MSDSTTHDEPDFGKNEAARLEEAVRMGARGMKIFKALGLTIRDSSGSLVPVDDLQLFFLAAAHAPDDRVGLAHGGGQRGAQPGLHRRGLAWHPL